MRPYKHRKTAESREIDTNSRKRAYISCYAPRSRRNKSPASVGRHSTPPIRFYDLKRRYRRKFSTANTLNLDAAASRHHGPLTGTCVAWHIPKLRWLYEPHWPTCLRAWASFTHASTHTASHWQLINKPEWSQAPSRCPDEAAHEYELHLGDVWRSVQSLQIPVHWNVLDAVNWGQVNVPAFASTDSSDSHHIAKASATTSLRLFPESFCETSDSETQPNATSLRLFPESFCDTSDSETQPNAITCHGNRIAHPRVRGQWNFFATIQPRYFCWKPQTIERSLRRDERRHSGIVDLNQSAHNHDIWPQNAFSTLASQFTGDDHRELLKQESEVPWQCIIGRRLVNVVETEMFPARYEKAMPWPKSLRDSGPTIDVDYTCRATPQYMGWDGDLCPLLFAAQFSHSGLPDSTAKLALASVFRPMMIIFLIYFLDTRKSVSDIMPPWMVLFGIVYTESGFCVHGHRLCFIPPTHPNIPVKQGGEWRAIAWPVGSLHRHDFLEPPSSRGSLLSTLNRIQGHCKYVLSQLKAWDGYERAAQLLL